MKIFTGKQGTVSVIEPEAGQASTPFVIRFDGAAVDNDLIRGILTNVSMSQETNVQFMHSLRDTIFVNVFGNRIGQMTVSGILFLSDVCFAGAGVDSSPPFQKFYEFYTNNNVVGKAAPINVQVGNNVTFKAFLLSFNFSVADAQTSLGQFTMNLALVPKTK